MKIKTKQLHRNARVPPQYHRKTGCGARRGRRKVFVAMSGGVDSSVAALLLKKLGCDVSGVFMRCYNADGCAERDAEDARRVAEKLGIPFYVWDFEQEYKARVVEYMIDGYAKGITPNPDVMCNREIKFGIFYDRAMELGADYVATGHYVRVVRDVRRSNRTPDTRSDRAPNIPRLYQAKDSNKDQSYFLWTLARNKLARCLFPIGEYLKPEVRAIARRAGLPTAEKKDSQGICFLGRVAIADFVGQYIPEKRGMVVSTAGEEIGEHAGAHLYTIGQRQGIGNIKHQKGNRVHVPVYVAEKHIEANTIVVAQGPDHPALYRAEIELADVNLIGEMGGFSPEAPVLARVRYRQPLAKARVEKHTSGIRIVFDEPQKFVAPGQSAVFYSESGELLGGGVIVR